MERGYNLFSIISIDKRMKTKWELFLERFKSAKVHTEEVNLQNGKSFFIIKTELHRGKIPWKEIEENSLCRHFILPFDTKSDEGGIREYEPKLLPEIMFFNSAVDYIERKNLPPSKITVTTVDLKGSHAEKVEKLIKFASNITVVTEETEVYKRLSKKLMADYGISLVIRNRNDEIGSTDSFFIDYEGETVPLSFSGTVFSKKKKHLLNGKALSPGGFTMPDEYEKLWQKNTDKLHFASALFELCDVKELGDMMFDELCS